MLEDEMPSETGSKHLRHLAILEGKSDIFKRLHHASSREPTQVTTPYGTALIFRIVSRQFGKILSALCQLPYAHQFGLAGDRDRVNARVAHLHNMARVHLFVRTLFLYQQDMKTELRTDHRTHLAYRRLVSGFLKWPYETERNEPSHFAMILLSGRVF